MRWSGHLWASDHRGCYHFFAFPSSGSSSLRLLSTSCRACACPHFLGGSSTRRNRERSVYTANLPIYDPSSVAGATTASSASLSRPSGATTTACLLPDHSGAAKWHLATFSWGLPAVVYLYDSGPPKPGASPAYPLIPDSSARCRLVGPQFRRSDGGPWLSWGR